MSAHGEQSFLSKYVFSTDHKVIAKQYTFTGIFFAFIGGLMAVAFRIQLAWPGTSVPLIGTIDGNTYNMLVTNHAMVMFFWAAMPVLVAGLGNFLIPLMIGCDDMAFPFLNMLSYWVFFVSCLVLVLSFLMPGGGAATGWTIYPPLSATQNIDPSAGLFTNLFTGGSLLILAVALEFVSILMGGINFITTSINMRAKGMKLMQTPIVVWFLNLATVDFMFSVGPLVAGAVMLLFDRVLGTGFYDPARGGDPVLFQHLFWFFGHPEVYVVLLPALGILAEILPVFTRKPLFMYKWIVIMAVSSAFIALIVWAHHQFVAGIDPRMAVFFSITTIIISIPFAMIFFAFIATLFGGQIEVKTPMLWALGFLGLFLVGGVTGIYLGSAAFDIYAHDSYFVVAHFHYTLIPVVFFGSLAGFYFWFPKFSGRMMNEGLGKLHFWGTFAGINLFAFPLFFSGMYGQHRRIFDYSAYEPLMESWIQGGLFSIRSLATIGAIILAASQLIFFVNIFISAKSGEKAGKNPWNANTFEWSAESPPPHGNFATPPTCYRGPYEYSNPKRSGSDFWPQSEA
jgi:cytochrome c oxidase subunit 1